MEQLCGDGTKEPWENPLPGAAEGERQGSKKDAGAPDQAAPSIFYYHGFGGFSLEFSQTRTNDSEETLTLSSLSNLRCLSKRPVFQSPYSPDEPHAVLPQPTGVGPFSVEDAFPSDGDADKRRILAEAIHQIDHQFENPQHRQEAEFSSFAVKTIEAENLWGAMARDHSTIGIRGLVAATDLKAGTPLVYSQQYVANERRMDLILHLALAFKSKINLDEKLLLQKAADVIASYRWPSIDFDGTTYFTSAFAAGNAGKLVNHESEQPNMEVVFLPTVCGPPAATEKRANEKSRGPSAVVYYTTRQVRAGEQLLVNYGERHVMRSGAISGRPWT